MIKERKKCSAIMFNLIKNFVVQNDTKILLLPPTTPRSTEIESTTVATVTSTVSVTKKIIGVLGYPPGQDDLLPDLPDLSVLLPLLVPVLLLSTWFLAGGIWAITTGVATKRLRSELEDISFLFQGQADALMFGKASMNQALTDMDRMLARVFMEPPNRKSGNQDGEPGFLGSVAEAAFRSVLMLLSLITGPLQSLVHTLGMVALRMNPRSGVLQEYMNWLDNRSSANRLAMQYIRDRGTTEPIFQQQTPFPNFYSQFQHVPLNQV